MSRVASSQWQSALDDAKCAFEWLQLAEAADCDITSDDRLCQPYLRKAVDALRASLTGAERMLQEIHAAKGVSE